jgi:formate dehydrogenase major subunit
MERVTTQQLAMMPIEFKLNGRTVIGRPDETIIETAKKNGVEIPHLCYKPGLRPDGNCRACVVEIKGERALAPSCCRYPKEGMEVTTNNPRAELSQRWCWSCFFRTCPSGSTRRTTSSTCGQGR